MNLVFDAIISTSLACGGSLLGHLFSRLPRPFWLIGYFIPLALILVYGVAVQFPALSFVPPVSWMTIGLKRFALMGFLAAMTLTTPLSRLPRRRDRLLVAALAAVIVLVMSAWPFLAPLLSRNQLAHLKTRVGPDGVCRQNTDYTCGPAAAVTALRQLGLAGDEGRIAILSCTSSATGTPPDILAEALQNEYRKDGFVAEFRAFQDISELKQAGLTIALVKFGFLVDHYVAVLGVTDSEVLVGDPLNGLDRMSYGEFLKRWRFTGIVVKRNFGKIEGHHNFFDDGLRRSGAIRGP